MKKIINYLKLNKLKKLINKQIKFKNKIILKNNQIKRKINN